MAWNIKEKLFLIGFIVTGLSILFILGIPNILISTNSFEPVKEPEKIQNDFEAAYNITTSTESIPLRIEYNFTTFDAYAVNNPISYSIEANVFGKDIDGIMIFLSDVENPSGIFTGNPINVLNLLKEKGSLIELTRSSDNPSIFFYKSTITPLKVETMYISPVIIKHPDITYVKRAAAFFDILPTTVILQANTNRALQQQIIEDKISNAHIEGLTWVK